MESIRNSQSLINGKHPGLLKQAIVGHLLDRFDHVRNVQQKACWSQITENSKERQLGTQNQQESSMTTSKCQGSAQGAADSKPRKL